MSNLSLRGVDPAVMAELKALAGKENASVNALVLRLIDRGLGRIPAKSTRLRHDDLDALAGCWSAKDSAAFEKVTGSFRQIEPALWR